MLLMRCRKFIKSSQPSQFQGVTNHIGMTGMSIYIQLP